MNIEEYSQKAFERLNPNIANKDKESMRFCCMGLLEESGEIIAELRKALFKGNFHEKSLDKNAIEEELGDLIWYIALTCINTDIDIKILEVEDVYKEFNREKLIKNGIKIGRQSGITAKRYFEYHKKRIKKEKLKKSIKKQYKNVLKIASALDISIDSILEKNTKKVNQRYDVYGNINKEGEKGEER